MTEAEKHLQFTQDLAKADKDLARARNDLALQEATIAPHLTAQRVTGGKAIVPQGLKDAVKAAKEAVKEAEKRRQDTLDGKPPEPKGLDGKRDRGEPLSNEAANTPLTPQENKLVRLGLGYSREEDPRHPAYEPPPDHIVIAAAFAQKLKKEENIALSAQEVVLMRHYTGDGYVATNGSLRGQQFDPNSSKAQKQTLIARATNQALAKLPAFVGEVRRDTRLPKELLATYKVGDRISFNGITSTTSELSASTTNTTQYASAEFGTKAGSYDFKAEWAGIDTSDRGRDSLPVQFRIKSKTGRDISYFSTRIGEKEVALPHGWSGKLVRIEDRPGLMKIYHLEE